MSKKLKIYFACSIRGQQDGLDTKDIIVKTLQSLGHEVLSEIFLSQDQTFNNGQKLTDQQIYQRDMKWISQADIIVAALGVSFGIGYELGWFDREGGKIVALLRGEKDNSFSAMASGNNRKNFHLYYWQNEQLLKQILKKELGKAND